MKIGVMLLPLMIFLSGCTHNVSNGNNNAAVECNSDSDCVAAGCSSQLCVSKEKASDIITTCEYREEYTCLKLASCDCVNNKCSWNENPAYTECLEGVRV